MLPDYQTLFKKYNHQLKPLISEIEGRLEYFSEPLLLNLASVFDYLSIAAADGQDYQVNIAEADGYIDRSLSHSYMYLIYCIKQSTDEFEKNLGKRCLRKLDDGRFIGKYMALKKKMAKLLKKAKKLDELEARPLLEEVYKIASGMEKMMNQEKPNMSFVQSESTSWRVVAVKWLLSIGLSVLTGYLVKCYLGG